MKYVNFIGLNFLFSLFIAIFCISYEIFPLNDSNTKIVNSYINNCDTDLINIKDINHKDYYLFSEKEINIIESINNKYSISWDGCNCISDILTLSCMNLEYNYCVNPIQDFEFIRIFNWTAKVIYFDYNGNYQNSAISFYQINIEEEKERLEKSFCDVI